MQTTDSSSIWQADVVDYLSAKLLVRFLRYVSIDTQSDSAEADKGAIPSTHGQWGLQECLRRSLRSWGSPTFASRRTVTCTRVCPPIAKARTACA